MLKFFTLVATAVVCVVGLLGVMIGIFLFTTPKPNDIRGCITTKMYQVHLCNKDPNYIPFKEISSIAKDAIMVSEDAAFYGHHGFDWDEMKNSFELNMEKGAFARGGSTITQQLAKNVYLTGDKSIFRKLREAVITVQLEKILSKNEIFEKYLNVVEFGPNLYGIGPASHFYFHKSPAELGPVEGAYLAFLLPSPKKYSVSFSKKQITHFALKQVSEIIVRLWRFKKLTAEERDQSLMQVPNLFGGRAGDVPVAPDVDETPDDGELNFNP